jgi:hypothetical protein
MTRPDAPDPRIADRRFTRDVAKHVDRRRMRRRMLVWLVLLALVAAAAAYLRCGGGLGLGLGGGGAQGLGDFDGNGAGSARVGTGARRCEIRLAAAGLTVAGKPMQRDDAIIVCKAAAGTDIIITGDAREDDLKELRAALRAAGITNIAEYESGRPRAGSN